MMRQHSKQQASTVCPALQPKMVYELTAVILNQIVSGRKSVLDAYGEIVFKAWRAATGACLERIETHLIQNVST
jgi:condensin-2 complex subunit G2